MSEKHLSLGSTEPEIGKGKLRLYSMRFCPYAQRVHLVLDAKQIQHDVVFINLTSKPEWYLDKYPEGKVPVIVDHKEALSESLLIADYLDEQYPQNPLHPKDPMKKAKDRLLVEKFSKATSLYYKVAFSPSPNSDDFENLLNELANYEKELSRRGTIFFGGDQPGMLDLMIWPWMERLDHLRITLGDGFKIPKGKYNLLMRWNDAMIENEAVKKSYLPSDIHAKYSKMRRAGAAPDYDNIIEA